MTILNVKFLCALAAGLHMTTALDLDVNQPKSIRQAAATISEGLIGLNQNNGSAADPNTGLFPFPPYYWYESGAAWGAMVDYWLYTGDKTYQTQTMSAIQAQTGPNYDFVPPQQSGNEANDDQAFWAFTVLAALESSFPSLPCPNSAYPSPDCPTSYLSLAIAIFEDYATRWIKDSVTCAGGLKWQYNPALAGYNYKNTVSNGGFFNLAARLALYTGNTTYAGWATRIYDWSAGVGFISPDFQVYDGAGDDNNQNCSQVDKQQWSYNLGIYLHGAAAMANLSSSTVQGEPWTDRVTGFMRAAQASFATPFPNATDVLYDACETAGACNTDQISFKAYLARFLGKSAVLVPEIRANVTELLRASAEGAAKSCSGAGVAVCGEKWYTGAWDGSRGLGQQIAALEVVQGLLAKGAPALVRMGI